MMPKALRPLSSTRWKRDSEPVRPEVILGARAVWSSRRPCRVAGPRGCLRRQALGTETQSPRHTGWVVGLLTFTSNDWTFISAETMFMTEPSAKPFFMPERL